MTGIGVGVIGLGMGEAHVAAYGTAAGVRVAGIADLDAGRLAACRERHGVPFATADYRQLLERPDIAAVSVCLPNVLHAPVTLEALAAGKHVLVEKPMAMSAAEAGRMIGAAKAAGRLLGVSMNYPWIFGPDSHYLRQLIGEGRLGSVYYVRAQSLRRRTYPRGKRTWANDRRQSGGGALIDMGPHKLDLAMWYAGDFEPRSASGVTRTALMTDTDVDDLACGIVRLAGGATIMLESTWASHTWGGGLITVLGTGAGAVLDLSKSAGQRLTLYGTDGETLTESRPTDISLKTPVEASVQEHFVAAIRGEVTLAVPGERGLAAMKIIDALYESSRTGREVSIPEGRLP